MQHAAPDELIETVRGLAGAQIRGVLEKCEFELAANNGREGRQPAATLGEALAEETQMNRTVRMLTTALAVAILASVLGNQVLIAQQAPVARTVLQQKDLEGGREVIMYRADVGPAGIAGRHYHPGPELFYVLDGTLTLELEGQPSVTLKAGESSYIPARHIHNVRNASAAGPAKVIVFMVGEKGQPLTTPVQ